jgi:hypothetical protein
VVCFFARGVYTPECVIKAMGAIGLEKLLKEEDLRKAIEIYGEMISAQKSVEC